MSNFTEQMQNITIRSTKLITVEPPRIWYHNGVRQAKTPGTFYTRASEFPNGLGAPWQPDERFDNEQGYSTAQLKIAVLAKRSQAFVQEKDATGKPAAGKPPTWLPRWEPGAQIYTELLCLIEGYDGPVVWAMKGLTGKAVTGKGGILQSYQNGLLKTAIREFRQGLPLYIFWLPIASKRTADGKVAYEDTGFGSFITPPAMYLPENPMQALFGGQDVIDRGETALAEYASWEAFQRLPSDTIEGEVVGAPALPAAGGTHRSIPQSLDDVDEL